MNYCCVLLAALFLTFAPLPCFAEALAKPSSTAVDGLIDWVYDYAAGQARSKASGKPMFVVIRCER